jgi:hypothetical protein
VTKHENKEQMRTSYMRDNALDLFLESTSSTVARLKVHANVLPLHVLPHPVFSENAIKVECDVAAWHGEHKVVDVKSRQLEPTSSRKAEVPCCNHRLFCCLLCRSLISIPHSE